MLCTRSSTGALHRSVWSVDQHAELRCSAMHATQQWGQKQLCMWPCHGASSADAAYIWPSLRCLRCYAIARPWACTSHAMERPCHHPRLRTHRAVCSSVAQACMSHGVSKPQVSPLLCGCAAQPSGALLPGRPGKSAHAAFARLLELSIQAPACACSVLGGHLMLAARLRMRPNTQTTSGCSRRLWAAQGGWRVCTPEMSRLVLADGLMACSLSWRSWFELEEVWQDGG